MSKFQRKFIKPTQISKHLNCTICTDVFWEPMRLQCEHTFCLECIDTWLKSNKTCPICREKTTITEAKRNRLAQNLINEFEVFCVNSSCVWKDKLENLAKHIQNCEFEGKNLPEWIRECEKISSSLDVTNKLEWDENNEQLLERMNQEIPQQSILMRLYNKDSKTRELLKKTLDNTPSPKSNKYGLNIDADLMNFFSDEETTEEKKELPNSLKEKKNSTKSGPLADSEANNDLVYKTEVFYNYDFSSNITKKRKINTDHKPELRPRKKEKDATAEGNTASITFEKVE